MQLVADIGATHARFQLTNDNQWQGDAWVGRTQDFSDGNELLLHAMRELKVGVGKVGAGKLHSSVIAVAGPEQTQGVRTLTNTDLKVSLVDCQQTLDCPVALVNDFYALARGVPEFTELSQLGGGEVVRATKALLGPGSGLGMASLVVVGEGWQVLAGEGGHADFAPGNHLETELWNVMTAKFGHVSWETVLCGPGLINLYEAMCATWGSLPDELSAAQISLRGQEMSDLVCHQTLETFCGLLGAAAGNLALTVGAKGGVYIGGGIAPRMLEFLVTSPLRRRFEDKGAMSHFVADIPILVITEQNPGLLGARACLADSSF